MASELVSWALAIGTVIALFVFAPEWTIGIALWIADALGLW